MDNRIGFFPAVCSMLLYWPIILTVVIYYLLYYFNKFNITREKVIVFLGVIVASIGLFASGLMHDGYSLNGKDMSLRIDQKTNNIDLQRADVKLVDFHYSDIIYRLDGITVYNLAVGKFEVFEKGFIANLLITGTNSEAILIYDGESYYCISNDEVGSLYDYIQKVKSANSP